MSKKFSRQIIPCRMDFVNCWEAKSFNGSEPKYRIRAIIPKSNLEVISLLNKSIEQAKQDYLYLWGGKIPENLKLPLHDGDLERSDDEAYKGCIFFNATSTYPPEVVDLKVKPIINHDDVYSGCHANISINFYGYSVDGSNGIAVGLGNIQKTFDDENLALRNRAVDEFQVLEDSFLS